MRALRTSNRQDKNRFFHYVGDRPTVTSFLVFLFSDLLEQTLVIGWCIFSGLRPTKPFMPIYIKWNIC